MIYGYIRVSTDSQDCENQKIGIELKAISFGLSAELERELISQRTKEALLRLKKNKAKNLGANMAAGTKNAN